MALFKQLRLWIDPQIRTGPEAMAVDEWLLETASLPVLRIYAWKGMWGSMGYFGKEAHARESFPEINWVRRWTGGGIVDHRADWTYTVIVPASSAQARLRGAESYRVVHQALAEALAAEGIDARIAGGAEQTGSSLCFQNPVGHDLVDASGRKLAGAGQRRTRRGMLHQGSVALPCDAALSVSRAERFACTLSISWDADDFQPPGEWILQKVSSRYGCPAWTARC